MNDKSGARTAQGTVEHWYIHREVDAGPSSSPLEGPQPMPMPPPVPLDLPLPLPQSQPLSQPQPIPLPLDLPIPQPLPQPAPMPCLLLRAGSSKKECSGQSRALWCEELLPACAAFYRQHCVVSSSSNGNSNSSGSSRSSNSHVEEEKDHGKEREDGTEKGQEEQDIPSPSVNARLLIICEDGMLSCTAALSLLLSHYHTSINFNTRLPFSALTSSPSSATACGRVRRGQGEREGDTQERGERQGQGRAVRVPSRSKEEIRMCLTALQMHVPFADQLPRRLVKELNMFFTSISISTSTSFDKNKQKQKR